MSTIKSSDEHLTLNADGSSKDIKFQANGVEKASISSSGAFTSTTIDATKLTGNLPAVNGSALTNLTAANLTGALPAISGAALTGISGGKVLQVIYQSGSTGITFTSSSSNLELESATITPAATSSKILCIASYNIYMNGTSSFTAAASIRQGSTTLATHDHHRSGTAFKHGADTLITLHSPNTTSATEYKLTISGSSNSGEVNTEDDTNGISLTLIEIGA